MISRSLALGVIAVACVSAAAGGSYLAVRQNAAEPAAALAPVTTAAPATAAVQETEAVVATAEPAVERPAELAPTPTPALRRKAVERRTVTRRSSTGSTPRPEVVPEPATPVVETTAPLTSAPTSATEPAASVPAPAVSEPAARPAEPVYDEIVLPATSVVGLELETPLTSERSQVEDRVDARVTRDVYAAGRLAIPAGSRVIGSVTLVERGGKVKERARLGVRFHTLVLAGGRQIDLRTEPIYREGESPANDSSKKIGGAAIGGAVLGAILGGGKGAIAGGAAGAAGGTAVVMAGDRKPATLPVGSIVTVKLTAPVTLEVER